MKILVIDDSENILSFTKNLLEKIGIEKYILTEKSHDTLLILEDSFEANEPIDLIISDFLMPDFTGLDVVKAVRNYEGSNKSIKDIPILISTAEAEINSMMEMINEGASDYIVKPFTKDQLDEKIKKFIKL
jgi:two-component system, chemotaxis family, chemotaxis protein CheY